MVSLEEKIFENGKKNPKKAAVISGKEIVTYGQICARSLWIADYLKKTGIRSGDIVLLQAIPKPQYVCAYIAVHLLGAVAVPIDMHATKEVVCRIAGHLGAKYMIHKNIFADGSEQGNGNIMQAIPYNALDGEAESDRNRIETIKNEDDVYDILYTTGTTGVSKGVLTTRKSVLAAIRNEIEGPGMTEDDVLLIPIPLSHSFGIGKMRAALYLGATVVLQNGCGFVGSMKKTIEQYCCTSMIVVPSALKMIQEQSAGRIGEVLGGLRFIEAASAPFSAELKRTVQEALPGVHILNRYGSTETPGAVYLDVTERPDKAESIGKALSNVKVRIVDEDGTEIPEGINKIGRLAISGDMLMKGYHGDAEMTDSVLRDGWMYSNDLACIDADGYIFLKGRVDDVINVGGEKVSPQEVEMAAEQADGIRECACIGVEDTEGTLGNVPVLFVVPTDNVFSEESMRRYLAGRLERYKLPAYYVVLPELPRNQMQKLDRKELKKIWKQHAENRVDL